MNLLFCFRKNFFFFLFSPLFVQEGVEIYKLAVNVCSNLIGYFEVVPLAPAPTII